MAKSVWDKLKDMMNTDSGYGDNRNQRTPSKLTLMVVPDFNDEKIVRKYISGISDFDYNEATKNRARETHKDRVNTIVNAFYDNFDKVKLKKGSGNGLEYKSFAINFDSSYITLCYVRIELDGESYRLPLTKYELARSKFLSEFLLEQDMKKKNAKLDAMLGVTTAFKSKRLKGGTIQITEEEILDSLLQTHPQHFI